MAQNFDDTLIKLLRKEAAKEKWKRILRITGTVLEKNTITKGKRKKRTKVRLVVKTATKRYDIPVPERLRKKAETTIKKEDKIKIIAGRRFGSVVVYGIKKIDKEINKEKQTRLTSEDWQ